MERNPTSARSGDLPRPNPTSHKNQSGGGWLVTALLFCAMIGSASAVDVPLMVVLKGQNFVQSGPTVAALIEEDRSQDEVPLVFEAFAQGEAADSLVSGTLGLPGGGSVPLEVGEDSMKEWQYTYNAETLLELNTVWEDGTYTFNLTTKNDGVQSIAVDLTGDTYPNVPQITNYNPLQTADPTAEITVQWAAMTGGTLNDFVMCDVVDRDTGATVYQSGGPGMPGALNGTSVQAVIPADTLSPGRSYETEVLFVKVVGVNTSYTGATAIAGYYKLVKSTIKTPASSGVALGATFEAAVPQPHTWDVARDSAISFRFSHPMNTGFQSVSWTGVSPSNFTYEWIDGNKVLLCHSSIDLPADTDVGWSLDLSAFRDAAGFALAGSEQGSFHTLPDAPGSRPDVAGIYALKVRSFSQTGTSPVSDGMYFCDAEVELNAYNRVKTATLTMPGGSTVLEHSPWDPSMELEANYASKTDLDRFFPNGNFTFDMATLADGPQSVTLSLGTSDDYPAAPTVTNLAALQTIDPAVATTITWTALAGWSATPAVGVGVIDLEIDNSQDNEVFWVDNESLSSGSQCVIPAGTLWPGRTYRVNLEFTKITDLDDTSYPGVLAGAGFSSITQFTIQTTGTPVMPAITVEKSGDAMNVNFVGGEPQRNYVIESSRDLFSWRTLEERWSDGGSDFIFDNDARYVGLRFYRLRDRLAGEQVQFKRVIQGTVWTDGTQSTPVVGAVVGTSMDAQTAVTDSNGRFFLETDTPNGSGAYTVGVTSSASHKDFGPYTGDQPREQDYEMN